MPHEIILNRLTVGYEGVPVVSDVDMIIKKGEIITLIGPNGSGKSTILKTIACQLAAVNGDVSYNGIKLDASTRERAEIVAAAMTEKHIDQGITCREVVEMGRYPHTGFLGRLSPADDRLVDETMRQMKIEDLGDRLFARISDGQRQRVILARAFVQETPVIILDEPTSYLDIRYRLEFLEALKKIAADGQKTVILSLHELDAAAEISDRIICLEGDGKVKIGTPEEILLGGRLGSIYGVDSEASERYLERLQNYLEDIIRNRE